VSQYAILAVPLIDFARASHSGAAVLRCGVERRNGTKGGGEGVEGRE